MENNKPYPTNQVDMQGFFLHLYKWRWPILSVVSIAVIGAVIFSGPAFISPKYKATVIVYASKTYSVSKSILGDTYHPDILEFGEEEQAEKLIQIINSDQIRNTVIDSYDLANHYKISEQICIIHTKKI
jgi:uncharacterized protein involved in exopolysaccharide biosynthesis